MKKFGLIGCAGLLVLGLIALAVVGWGSGHYNRLVALDEGVDTEWAQVEDAYQRRTDLIPNLVNTVKGAADFEKDTFESVTRARSQVGQINFQGTPSPEQLAEYQNAQGELSSALSRLLLVVERYPELKATEAFRDLQSQLEGTENRISVARQRFNDAARSYNTKRRVFPTNLIANVLGFDEKPYFQSDPGSDEPPTVDFS